MSELLKVEQLTFSYDSDRVILDHASFSLNSGELMILLGPNGAGKSTLLNCITGFLRPQSGQILLEGRPVLDFSPNELACEIAYVPQSFASVYAYKVKDYIAMGRAPHLKLFGRPGPEDEAIVERAMERLEITHLAKKRCTYLSGGERQLVNVCRAVVQNPKLIIFDEPTSALDFGNQIRTLHMIKSLQRDGYAILMTTHNPDHGFQLNSKVSILGSGGHLQTGTADELITEQNLSQIYQAPIAVSYMEKAGRKACLSMFQETV